MSLKRGLSRLVGFSSLTCLAYLVSGCQQVSEPTQPTASGEKSDLMGNYAAEVQRAKTEFPGSLDQEILRLDKKYGFNPSNPAAEELSESPVALQKAAAALVYSNTRNCQGVFKLVVKAKAGDRMNLKAVSINYANLGYSDPIAYLIQFWDPNFIETGAIPAGSSAFTVIARNDDVAPGNLSAAIDHVFKANQNGYFMFMVVPKVNASSSRYTDISFDNYACGNCDYVIGRRKVGGSVYQSVGADDFRATRTDGTGDPALYVIQYGNDFGILNNDKNSDSKDSKIYPWLVPSSSEDPNSEIFVDNMQSGSSPFRHTQYAP